MDTIDTAAYPDEKLNEYGFSLVTNPWNIIPFNTIAITGSKKKTSLMIFSFCIFFSANFLSLKFKLLKTSPHLSNMNST